VFSRGKEGDVFVNLKGRDPHGIVRPGAEYEAVRDQVIERLGGLLDPATGRCAVDRVYRREELYQGPMIDYAPDLLIAWRNTMYQPTESDRDRQHVFVERWRQGMDWPTSGSHRVNGILFASGAGIRRGVTIEGAGIADLVPTWLAAAGLEIPADLEGQPLRALFNGSP
jgi:predicted AlkP superfamily phosphohydrolase/phosphomutase